MLAEVNFPNKRSKRQNTGKQAKGNKEAEGKNDADMRDLKVGHRPGFREAQMAVAAHMNMHDVGFRWGAPSPPGDDGDHGGPPDDRDDGHRGKRYTCSIRKGLVCKMDSNCYWRSQVLLLSPNAHLDWQGDAWMTCRERWGELSGKELPTWKDWKRLCNAAWRDRMASNHGCYKHRVRDVTWKKAEDDIDARHIDESAKKYRDRVSEQVRHLASLMVTAGHRGLRRAGTGVAEEGP